MGFGRMTKVTPGSNKLWEGSRMMLPEHVQALVQQQINENRRERPELDEQQVEELGWQLQEAIESKTPVEITLFGEFRDRTIVGVVTKVDTRYMRVRVEYEDDYDWIPVGDILGIDFT